MHRDKAKEKDYAYAHEPTYKELYVLIWTSDLSTEDCLALEETAYNMTRREGTK